MTISERASLIIKNIVNETSKNPVQIFRNIAGNPYVSIHGPEHHILDGACLLTAYKNAGGNVTGYGYVYSTDVVNNSKNTLYYFVKGSENNKETHVVKQIE